MLFIGIASAIIAFTWALVLAATHSQNALHAEYEQRCAAHDMSYSRQSHTRGKVHVSWDYCVTPDGTIKEIP